MARCRGIRHCVQLVEAFQHKSKFYVVSRYANGGDLTDFLSDTVKSSYMSEDLARLVFKQVSNAVFELHKLGIYHRDIKMMNIFVHQGGSRKDTKFMLADFGNAQVLQDGEMLTDMQGTMHWMAPEVMKKQENGLKADIWSLGVLLYALICGEPPYDGNSYTQLREEFTKKNISFEHQAW